MTKYINPPKDTSNSEQLGILLLNLGTPDTPNRAGLYRYLKQFLGDPRVIELPRWFWWLILNLRVLPTRPAQSAKLYAKVWTKEGSPLLVTSQKQKAKLLANLSARFGSKVSVALGMRYGNPSVQSALEELRSKAVNKLLVFPLYPQYSGASTGSTFDAVFDVLKRWRVLPELRTIRDYHAHPFYIEALAQSVRDYWGKHGRGDKLLMSYHSIPRRYVNNGDLYQEHCRTTSALLAAALGLSKEEFLVSFQSRFGSEEWLKPYTDELLTFLGKNGVRRLDVICPGFSVDCLETLEEIEGLGREQFTQAGGQELHYIACLNDSHGSIRLFEQLIYENCSHWLKEPAGATDSAPGWTATSQCISR